MAKQHFVVKSIDKSYEYYFLDKLTLSQKIDTEEWTQNNELTELYYGIPVYINSKEEVIALNFHNEGILLKSVEHFKETYHTLHITKDENGKVYNFLIINKEDIQRYLSSKKYDFTKSEELSHKHFHVFLSKYGHIFYVDEYYRDGNLFYTSEGFNHFMKYVIQADVPLAIPVIAYIKEEED